MRLSTKPFCIGLAEAMSCQPTPRFRCRRRMAREVNSLPRRGLLPTTAFRMDRAVCKCASVAGDGTRRLAALGEAISLASDAPARERGLGDQRRTFPAEAAPDARQSEPPAVGHHVGDEAETPALVRPHPRAERRPRAVRVLVGTELANNQPLLAIKPELAFMVHLEGLAAEEDQQPPIAEPGPLGCQLTQPPT